MFNIEKPTLLLNKQQCLANIRYMSEKAQRNYLEFRPHFKTHQSAEIGEWFRGFGVNKITVSSVTMAEYFAANNWTDITIAFPVNLREINSINYLAKSITLNLLVESVETVEFLNSNLDNIVNLFIKIDTGNNRTGVDSKNFNLISKIISKIDSAEKILFKGFLSHAGHTYKAISPEQIGAFHRQQISSLKNLKKLFRNASEEIILSIGDTPACTLEDYFEDIDEIRPGNFVFYDVMQYELSVCDTGVIAVCLACPVVAVHKNRQEIVVYGGAVHLSKETITDGFDRKYYGLVVKLNKGRWDMPLKDCYVKALSQEHGIIKMGEKEIQNINPGDIIGILPIHSCLTANLMKQYLTLENEIITMMR
ncbi:MAG: alanine racemase [Bacteroidetes bacterium]|nr:alanine racemase [Bacteroidota bacterium]